jgi:hypothetical protein
MCRGRFLENNYPNLSSMPCRMVEVCHAVSVYVTGVSMLSRQEISQALQNTLRVHIDKDVWTIINGYYLSDSIFQCH